MFGDNANDNKGIYYDENNDNENAVSVAERLPEGDRFVRARPGTKEPAGTWDTGGPETVDRDYLIQCGDGLVVFDVDDYEKTPEWVRDIIRENDTFTVKSPHAGPGEGHFYFAVNGSVPTKHPEWGDIIGDVLVMGPGSHLTDCKHGCCTSENPGVYRVVDDREIATVSADRLRIDDDDNETTDTNPTVNPDPPEPVDVNNIGDRIRAGKEHSTRFKELMEWAETNGDPASVGFPDNRSGAECSLAWHLAFWLARDKEAVRRVIEGLNPPRWAEEEAGYRDSVLEAVDVQPDTFDPKAGESGPSLELVVSVYFDLLGTDRASTSDIVESVGYGETQTRKALNDLERLGFVRYVRDGRQSWWIARDLRDEMWRILEDEFNPLETREEFLMNRNLRRYGTDSRAEDEG